MLEIFHIDEDDIKLLILLLFYILSARVMDVCHNYSFYVELGSTQGFLNTR